MWLFGRSRDDGAEAATLVEEGDPELGESSGTSSSRWAVFSSLPSSFNLSRAEDAERVTPETTDVDAEVTAMCADLSYETRLYGFLFCFAIGTLMSLSSSFFVPSIVLKPEKFALPYTIGNVLSMGSSMFFVGPARFFKTLFNETRRVAAILYLSTLVLTFVAAIYLHMGLLCFVLIIVQFSSYLWLMASYIPYGRNMLQGCTRRVFSFFMS
ncbi:Vesicle transport protein SFT2A [Hondaea fermentalgiana]|uniref:Vesicle transport protein n=1 Tax=Hondaea fermentalgiana TaxID=2315210 RepID=A0A2R5GQ80_9STRA|nr:Vesicle transport protein SFT2A [Hondaea fermentalgiana]|eukprot:GBG33010.1 Vesicle transport protein SFT2A [Hondaea fermentalgiana]